MRETSRLHWLTTTTILFMLTYPDCKYWSLKHVDQMPIKASTCILSPQSASFSTWLERELGILLSSNFQVNSLNYCLYFLTVQLWIMNFPIYIVLDFCSCWIAKMGKSKVAKLMKSLSVNIWEINITQDGLEERCP